MMTATLLLLAALLLSAASFSSPAPSVGLRFSNVFQSRMVLQRDRAIEVWGFGASPSASTLSVHLGEDVSAPVFWPVNSDGSWKAVLPAIRGFGCNGTELVLKSGGIPVQTLSDICIGDVYLFSGQSNIDVPEAYAHQSDPTAQAKEEAFAEANPDIRLMIVPNQVAGLDYTAAPASELAAGVPDSPLCPPPFGTDGKYQYCQANVLRWARANGTVVRGFSATAWFTGTALRKAQDKDRRVPLGLVRSSWGGTKIRAWSSPEAIDVCRQQNPAPAGSTSMLFSNMILPLVGLEFSAVVWCEWHDS